jgi:hypothetical protein
MGLLDDLTAFLEQRLEEFLRSHPELELQALDENLREQEADLRRSLVDLQAQQHQAEQDILTTAQEIQRWHERIQKAKTANRQDLVEAAQEREAGDKWKCCEPACSKPRSCCNRCKPDGRRCNSRFSRNCGSGKPRRPEVVQQLVQQLAVPQPEQLLALVAQEAPVQEVAVAGTIAVPMPNPTP